MLPLPGAITSQLDKASIIRLTISFLKIGEFSSQGDPPWAREPPPNKLYKSKYLLSGCVKRQSCQREYPWCSKSISQD